MKKPTRAIELEIKVSADSWRFASDELRAIADRIDSEGAIIELISGSYTASHTVIATENPDQTGDRYRSELVKYIESSLHQKSQDPQCPNTQ